MIALLLAIIWPAVPGSAMFTEMLQSQGLLGAHFGRPGLAASFDYVIVGGGTAGLTLARRLASDTDCLVAVIEAGGFYEMDNGNLSEVPANAGYFLGTDPALMNPLIDWSQHTTPQPGLGGRTALYTQGKTFGGSSARNFMFYQRGTKGSYHKWATDVGDSSYEFSSLLPYFEKSVQFTPPKASVRAANATVEYDSSVFSTTGGPLQVSYPNWANPFSSWLAKAFRQLHIQKIPGFNSGNLLGWQYVTNTLDPNMQTRSSSETSFLRDALRSTTNVAFYQSTLGKRILFDESKKAIGVSVSSGGAVYTINATKEVIVSAGVFRSPQLLMVSGIGPKATLASLGISQVANRPGVGQNLWDHVLVGPTYEVDVTTHSQLGNPGAAAQANAEYLQNRTGLLTNPGGDIIGFEKLPNGSIPSSVRTSLDATFPADWPDVEILALDAYSGNQKDFILGAPQDGKNYAASILGLVAPFSRGNVSINSSDTAVHPVVSPNWLLDKRDQAVAIAAFKRARTIFEQSSLRPVVIGEAFPGSNVSTDAEIWEVIQQSASTIYHAAGTCKMGRTGDEYAVVDSKARVIGVDGLRVVDASAFPLLPPGHPQSTVYALAEKIAADIIGR